jgi:hypothetical protein
VEVEFGKILLKKIPHERGEIIFEYPSYSGCYGEIALAIDKAGLKRPSSAETASLICNAWEKPTGEYESQILNVIKEHWLFEFSGNYYLPKGKGDIQNGVILQDNPLIMDEKLIMNKDDLIKKLDDAEEFMVRGYPIYISEDRSIRFVPFGYKITSQTPPELAINSYIVARYLGRKNNELEGAEKIARVASKYKTNPYLYSFGSVDKEEIRMSGLDSAFGCSKLILSGDIINYKSHGYAFGKYEEKK